LENKKLTDITNLSTHEVANFVIQGFVGKPTFEKLKLRRTYGLTNMVLLDMNNIPRKYRSIDGLLEEFFRIRLPYYALRKQNMLEEITRSIKVLDDKYRFLKLVIEDKIIIFKRSKQEIIEQMKKFNIPEELLSSVRLSSLSLEELTELQKEILALKEEESAMEKLLPEDMWINDLKEFKKKYEEMFGKDMKEELEGDDIEDDDETIPYTRPKKEKKQELSEFQSKKISKIGRRLKLTKEETTPQ
jgi:DNA topoisomerase-2